MVLEQLPTFPELFPKSSLAQNPFELLRKQTRKNWALRKQIFKVLTLFQYYSYKHTRHSFRD